MGGYLFFKKKAAKIIYCKVRWSGLGEFQGKREKEKGKGDFKWILIFSPPPSPSFLRPFALKMHQGRLVRGKSF